MPRPKPNDGLDAKTRYMRKVRREVLAAMGGCCQCCGEREPKFLCIDHIHGLQGAKRPGGVSIYFHVRREGYPKQRYQILCHNCNMAKSLYGLCPHFVQLDGPPFEGPKQP